MLRIAQTLEAQLRAAWQAFPEADGELNPALGPANKPSLVISKPTAPSPWPSR